MKNIQKGFTLVELSIVLVIIGLVVAGVTAGQGLIRQAKLRNILTETDKFKLALNDFQMAYNALPGDISNAFSYWGTNCAASAPLCDGDGSRNLSGSTDQERLMMWRHLDLAKILNGSYSGTKGGDGTYRVKIDIPGSAFANNAGYSFTNDDFWGVLPKKHDMIIFGGQVATGDNYAAILTPTEAFSIDKKIDDDNPIGGHVFSGTGAGASGHCINGTGWDDATGATTYVLSNTKVACRMLFWGFNMK